MDGGAGGLLLLGVGVMLLMMYVTGRLDWLFALGRDANALRTGESAPAPGSSGAPADASSLARTRVPGAGVPARP
jgi:hypothetical protein